MAATWRLVWNPSARHSGLAWRRRWPTTPSHAQARRRLAASTPMKILSPAIASRPRRFRESRMSILPISAARVFFDGIFTEPRVAHPEGIAIHPDGSIWCGTETGDLLRIAADGSNVERMGATAGFAL